MNMKPIAAGTTLLALLAAFSPGASGGTTAPNCFSPGKCILARNAMSGPIADSRYSAHAGGVIFGINARNVTYCRVQSTVHRNGKRIATLQYNCLAMLRRSPSFMNFADGDLTLFKATCSKPTTLRSQVTIVLNGTTRRTPVARATARPCAPT